MIKTFTLNLFSGFLIGCLFITQSACGSRDADGDDGLHTSSEQRSLPVDEQPVEVAAILIGTEEFQEELIANGKLEALHRANLRFRLDGVLEGIHVAEGDRVQSGQLIATIDDEVSQWEKQRTLLSHQRALIDYEDQLLRMGYRLSDTANIDLAVKQNARLRSGLAEAEQGLARVERDLASARLYAPISGKIANVKGRLYHEASAFEYICTVVDDRELLVTFSVLEQELGFVRASKSVTVRSFSDISTEYYGQIASINPQVDQAGMVSVKARIRNTDGRLVDGMAVEVTITRMAGSHLAVPKEAVLDRQGRKVVFTATDEGTAYWNYVEIASENSTHYAISDGLKDGDRVIYDGNFNLAHDKPISMRVVP